jgi:hypothetical protein
LNANYRFLKSSPPKSQHHWKPWPIIAVTASVGRGCRTAGWCIRAERLGPEPMGRTACAGQCTSTRTARSGRRRQRGVERAQKIRRDCVFFSCTSIYTRRPVCLRGPASAPYARRRLTGKESPPRGSGWSAVVRAFFAGDWWWTAIARLYVAGGVWFQNLMVLFPFWIRFRFFSSVDFTGTNRIFPFDIICVFSPPFNLKAETAKIY